MRQEANMLPDSQLLKDQLKACPGASLFSFVPGKIW